MLSLALMNCIYHMVMHWTHFQGISHLLVVVDTCVEKCILSVRLGGKCHFDVFLMDECLFWVQSVSFSCGR